MPDFNEDMAWQARFRSHFAEIAVNVVRVDVASWADDARRNTDFMVATLENGHRLAARARRRHHLRHRDEFTIRSHRPSGATTEMAKIRDGWGDFMAYGFEAESGSDRLHPWALINLRLLREYLDGGGRWSSHRNNDGTAFAALALYDMPLGCVLSSDGHRLTTSTAKPCQVCGRPAFDCAIHLCCSAGAPGAPCDSCAASDALNRYRYGWPPTRSTRDHV